MLTTLRIRDLVLIQQLTVTFGPGLNLLTGETGAGKSILVDALGLVAGARADSAAVRRGAERAVVEAVFEPADRDALCRRLEQRGLEADENGALIVRREVAASGGGRVFINGSPSTVTVLRELAGALLDLHGQHEAQSLLSPERQLTLLDRFGGHAREREGVAAAWASWVEKQEALEDLRERGKSRALRAEELRRQIEEIDAVRPEPGELERLDGERGVLRHAGEVRDLLQALVGELYEGEPNASSMAAGAARRAARLAEIDPSLGELAERVEQARLDLQDVGDAFRDYRDRADFDPARLESTESRHAEIERLLLHYGETEQAVLDHAEAARAELTRLEHFDDELERVQAEVEVARSAYDKAAARLARKRRGAAGKLGPAVEAQLADLSLAKARLAFELEAAEPGPRGTERAEIRLQANPGEPPRPLARVASGGELSRVMLALHVVLGDAEQARSMVFDEVDTGVSGAVADAVGARLARLSARHQVLCVTHLPQVASHGDRHFQVRKQVAGKRTLTEVMELDAEQRIDELARMLGGREVTRASRQNARELLKAAAAVR